MSILNNFTNHPLKKILTYIANQKSHDEIIDMMVKDARLVIDVPKQVMGDSFNNSAFKEIISTTFSCGENCHAVLFARLTPYDDYIQIELSRSGLKLLSERYI